MKIIKLVAQNVKKIKAISIVPDPSKPIINITGPNASWKTSVLDCIFMAIGGKSAIPSKPVREGEDSAKVVLDLGECIVTRKFSKDGNSTLTVEALSGSRFPSPQKMLDGLLDGLAFDPLAFTRFEAKKQLETLKKLVKLEVDVDALDGLNQKDYEERTEVNRETKRLEAQLVSIKIPETSQEDLALDESALLKELASAADTNNEIVRAQTNRSTIRYKMDTIKNDLEKLRVAFAAKQNELFEIEQAYGKLPLDSELPKPVDVTEVKAKVERARVVSNAKRLLTQRDELTAGIKKSVDRASELTMQMEERLKVKEEAIRAAKMPLAGLSLGTDQVLYKGIPLDQCSSAEQLLISTVIAMNLNPQLRIIRIQDGSLLDSRSLTVISRLAERGDYQIWLETVESSDPMAIHMEDGEVVGTLMKAGD